MKICSQTLMSKSVIHRERPFHVETICLLSKVNPNK
nr:MAG TPA: hypothetical protein [Caudoviricetes sp.]